MDYNWDIGGNKSPVTNQLANPMAHLSESSGGSVANRRRHSWASWPYLTGNGGSTENLGIAATTISGYLLGLTGEAQMRNR